jgi:hypothetical protein
MKYSTTFLHPYATSSLLYADDTAIIATSCQLALLINYLESYLSNQKVAEEIGDQHLEEHHHAFCKGW